MCRWFDFDLRRCEILAGKISHLCLSLPRKTLKALSRIWNIQRFVIVADTFDYDDVIIVIAYLKYVTLAMSCC